MTMSVTVSKNVWGRVILSVETDCDFIETDKNMLTEENFAGGKLDYRFLSGKIRFMREKI